MWMRMWNGRQWFETRMLRCTNRVCTAQLPHAIVSDHVDVFIEGRLAAVLTIVQSWKV